MTEQTGGNGNAAASSNHLTLASIAAAAASSLGVLGFVTFAGGVVLWTRFDEMGLPADHAVALIPKSELVATGAEFLVPALGLATGMVLLLVFVRRLFGGGGDVMLPADRMLWTWGSGGLVFVVEVTFAFVALDTVHLLGLVLLLAVAGAGGIVVGLSVRLRSLSAFCLVAFLAVGTFWIARAYEQTSHAPSVIPMAYSRAQPGIAARVEIGYFVTETSDRIYFASLPQSNQNELREFPRSETDDLEVGQITPVSRAEARAARFALNLCGRLLALAPAARTANTTPVCSRKYLSELRTTAGVPQR